MRFCIITHVVHKYHNGKYYGYSPYIKEMDIWNKYPTEVVVIAPLVFSEPNAIETAYRCENIIFIAVPEFSTIGILAKLELIWKVPYITVILFAGILKSDHIHLRCPGNMGLLGCLVQILFPRKKKTTKYAGNWDRKSRQPFSYRLQQRILRNTFLTRNIQVLVYGDWKETKNILPFFTATYYRRDIIGTSPRLFNASKCIKLLFVGTLHAGKRPNLSLEATHKLLEKGVACELHFYGDGPESEELKRYCRKNDIEDSIFFHGNVCADDVKKAYKESDFLIFASQSEGWPKVVAESMFWGCLPITTAVSCVPEMIGYGLRGDLVKPTVNEISRVIEYYIKQPEEYRIKSEKAIIWSRQFTLDLFEEEIKKLLV
jgi:glycosyltransferase involved in cell wall biosynthesis